MELLKLAAAAYVGYIVGKRGYSAVVEESQALNKKAIEMLQQLADSSGDAAASTPTASPYMSGPSF